MALEFALVVEKISPGHEAYSRLKPRKPHILSPHFLLYDLLVPLSACLQLYRSIHGLETSRKLPQSSCATGARTLILRNSYSRSVFVINVWIRYPLYHSHRMNSVPCDSRTVGSSPNFVVFGVFHAPRVSAKRRADTNFANSCIIK